MTFVVLVAFVVVVMIAGRLIERKWGLAARFRYFLVLFLVLTALNILLGAVLATIVGALAAWWNYYQLGNYKQRQQRLDEIKK